MSSGFPYERVVFTGGAGFLGSYVLEKLHERGVENIFVTRSKDYDLIRSEDIRRLYDDANPDLVIHLAAVVGGIGANRANPGRYFYDNLMMGAQLMEEARLRDVKKFVATGTICFPPDTQINVAHGVMPISMVRIGDQVICSFSQHANWRLFCAAISRAMAAFQQAASDENGVSQPSPINLSGNSKH